MFCGADADSENIVYIDKHVADNNHRLPASVWQSLYDTENYEWQFNMKLCGANKQLLIVCHDCEKKCVAETDLHRTVSVKTTEGYEQENNTTQRDSKSMHLPNTEHKLMLEHQAHVAQTAPSSVQKLMGIST